jgi:hypothetical protein
MQSPRTQKVYRRTIMLDFSSYFLVHRIGYLVICMVLALNRDIEPLGLLENFTISNICSSSFHLLWYF